MRAPIGGGGNEADGAVGPEVAPFAATAGANVLGSASATRRAAPTAPTVAAASAARKRRRFSSDEIANPPALLAGGLRCAPRPRGPVYGIRVLPNSAATAKNRTISTGNILG